MGIAKVFALNANSEKEISQNNHSFSLVVTRCITFPSFCKRSSEKDEDVKGIVII